MMAQHLINIGSVHNVDLLEPAWYYAHSQNQVSAYFTSVQILSIEFAITSKEAVTSAKIKYIGLLDLQVSKYGLLAALWQLEMGRQLKSSICLIYQGADNAF